MKKIILTLTIALLTAGAFAQTTTPTTASTVKQTDSKDLRKDVRATRHDKKLRTYEVNHHDNAQAKTETKDIKAEKTNIKTDSKNLKQDGVKHPLKRADRQIHRQNIHHKP